LPIEEQFKDNKNVSKEILRLFQDESINNYSSQIEEGLLEKLKPSELIDILDSLSVERLTVFLISIADTIIPPEENIYNKFNIRLHYFGHIEPYVPISLKDKITGILEKSDLKSTDLLGEFLRDKWDLQLSIGIIDEKDYYLNKYYKILIEITDKSGISEEEIHSKMRESIEKGGSRINTAITATNELARVFGINDELEINVDEILSQRKQRKDLTNFKSIEEVDKFLKSKVPRFIKGRYARKGKIFKEYEDFDMAKECYEKALDIDSDDNYLICDFYEVLMALKEFEKAEFWLNKQLEQDHNWREDWAVQEKAYHYLIKDNIPKVLETLKTLLEKGSRDINWILQDLRFSDIVKTEDFKQFITPKKEFNVNDYLKLKLRVKDTIFYINDKKYQKNNLLYLDVPVKGIKNLSDLLTKYTVEVLADKFKALFDDGEYENNMSGLVPAEEEFKLMCLNLQLWVENSYDYRLLHPELALPLLKELVNVGDPIAKDAIKNVLVNTFTFGLPKFKKYLSEPIYESIRGSKWQNHMSYLTQTELMDGILNPSEATTMKEIIAFTETESRVLYEGWGDDDFLRRDSGQLHFLVEDKSVVSLDMELNKWHPSIPDSIENLKSLKSLRIMVYGDFFLLDFNKPIESLERLNLYIWGDIKIPNQFDFFPNLGFLEIRFFEGGSFKEDPTTLGSLIKLRHFSLNGVKLKKFPEYLLNLKRLRSANFRNTSLTELPKDLKITRKYRFSFYNSRFMQI